MHDASDSLPTVTSPGTYARGTQLHSGSFGAVWSGVHTATSTRVVLEAIPAVYAEATGFLPALAEHGRSYAELAHAALPRLYDVVSLDGQYFLVFAPARTIPIGRSARHPLDIHGFRQFASDLLEGLTELHSHSIIHGALSPSTVGIAGDGSASIFDTPMYSTLRSLSLQLPESVHIPEPLPPYSMRGDCESVCKVLEEVAIHSALPAALIRTLTANMNSLLAQNQSATAADVRGTILEDIREYLEPEQYQKSPHIPMTMNDSTKTPEPPPSPPASATTAARHPVRTALMGFLIVIVLIALFGTLWLFVLRPMLNSGKLALASAVHVNVQPSSGHCSATFTATGTGSTTGTGTLTYHWVDTLNTTPQESTSSPDLHLHIAPQDRSFRVIHSWTVTTKSSLSGSITLVITAPASHASSVPVHLSCTP